MPDRKIYPEQLTEGQASRGDEAKCLVEMFDDENLTGLNDYTFAFVI